MAAESPNRGNYFYLGLTSKKTGNLFRFGINGCRLFTNIPGLFLTVSDHVFSVVRPVKRRFLQKKRMLDLVYFSFMLYSLYE